ncbi:MULTISPECIES: PepSY domain-containing protein [Methylobacterium]|nr:MULTISPECIES: PepSY domain-containing protein [Methylobacterium]
MAAMPPHRTLPLLLLAAALACAGPSARAAEDADRARRALEQGEIRPLDEVLRAARAAAPGDVVSLDLKRSDGRWLYKLRILSADGKRRTLKVDAASLRILDGDEDDDD